jgi:hypothetical protein
LDATEVTLCRYLTAAVTKLAPLVLFADPQKAITRSGYISDSKYGEPRTANKSKEKNYEQTDKQNNSICQGYRHLICNTVKFGRQFEPGASVTVHPEEGSAVSPQHQFGATSLSAAQCGTTVENILLSAVVTALRVAQRYSRW